VAAAATPATALQDPVLNYGDLQQLAKAAISEEVTELNSVVATLGSLNLGRLESPLLKGYKNKDLEIFQRFGKSEGMDPDLIYDICIMTADSVTAITAKKFTKKNLGVSANLNA